MQELHYTDGYYNCKYREEDPQLTLKGVSYDHGSLVFKFIDSSHKIYDKSVRDPLEQHILSDILKGSRLWKYNASASEYVSYGNQIRKVVSIKINVDDLFVNSYKDEIGFRIYVSNYFSKLPVYSSNHGHPKLRDISYPSYFEPIQQPANFKVNLFEYQKKSLAKMLAIEKGEINLTCDYKFKMEFGETIINFNPNISAICNNKENTNIEIKTKGGILCDEMGLGKTITSLALVALNGSTLPKETMWKGDLLFSSATLIVCPSHLAKQWETEVMKVFPKAKIIKLLTKNNHVGLKYKDIKEADIVIVTQQFLMNFKYYPQVNYTNITPSNFVFSARISTLNKKLSDWKTNGDNIMSKTQPNLEHFSFHRLIVDEGHEIFGLQLANASVAKYMSDWLRQVNSDYYWFVSGTPFVNCDGMYKCFSFVKMKLIDSFTKSDFVDRTFVQKKYITDQILKSLLIRNRKVDVENQIEIPGYEEEVIWVNLTELERNLYNSKKSNSVSDTTLQKLCCHILVSDSTDRYFGSNVEVDLEQMQDQLIKYHEDTVNLYQHKLNNLSPENQAYAMVKKNYTTKISESKYMLGILNKMSKKDEIDLEQNCSICFDTMTNPSLTPCGHMFCKECLEMCLQIKKLCPMCKADLKGKEIYMVESKKKKVEEESNPLIKKYGSKLGKLISIVRSLTAIDENRIIIFSQWDRMLNLIGKSLSENGVANSFVKGNVWSRNSAINKFKLGKNSSGDDNKVIMLSLSNSASGTNLTEATHIIFVEPINTTNDEVRAIEGQAIGRACRLGQTNKVKVIRILTKDTIEENIYENIYSKNLDNIKRTILMDDGNLDENIEIEV